MSPLIVSKQEMDFNAQLDLYEAFKFLLLDDACSIFLKSVQTALSNRSARVQNLSLLRKPSDQVLIDITIQGIPEELKELFTTVDSDWRRGSPIANSLTLKNLVMCQSRLWRSVDGVCREPDPSQLANGMAVLGHWYDMRGGVPPEDGQTILEVIMNLFVGV